MSDAAKCVLLVIVTLAVVAGAIVGLEHAAQRSIERNDAKKQQARRMGYDAAAAGVPPTACEFVGQWQNDARSEWMRGWQQYHMERAKQ